MAPPGRRCLQQRKPCWGSGTKPAPPHVPYLQPHLHPTPVKATLAPGSVGSPVSSSPPLSLQDLLALLHEHGPSTEGIFRRTVGERAFRELREALDSGAQVHLESQPVHLLAIIFKVNPADLEPRSSRLCRG